MNISEFCFKTGRDEVEGYKLAANLLGLVGRNKDSALLMRESYHLYYLGRPMFAPSHVEGIDIEPLLADAYKIYVKAQEAK